jgi:acyl-CoA thioester hydrolase
VSDLAAPGWEPVVWREEVRDEWIDYNGHLSEAFYVLVFGHATDAVMERVGLGEDYRAARDASLFTVEAHVRYLDQVPAGVTLEVRSWVVASTAKLLHVWHEMYAEERLRATEEVLGVHVDAAAGRSTPFPADVRTLVEAARGPVPDASGRAIALATR